MASKKENGNKSSEKKLREPAEVQYAEQLQALIENDVKDKPENWLLSPAAVLTYIVGGEKSTLKKDGKTKNIEISKKFSKKIIQVKYGSSHV